ncbi:MAG: four helix bundle protein [Bacteroidota bacterium]|nr:four helix bundle protein [Bacteroidota bacterium]
MSYKSLEIWKLSRQIALDIHRLSTSLPVHEKYELGSQIRRSSASIRANIVEGYGRRRYIKEKDQYWCLHDRLEKLGKMLNGFLQALDK